MCAFFGHLACFPSENAAQKIVVVTRRGVHERGFPPWVKVRHGRPADECPVRTQNRTQSSRVSSSHMCETRTSSLAQSCVRVASHTLSTKTPRSGMIPGQRKGGIRAPCLADEDVGCLRPIPGQHRSRPWPVYRHCHTVGRSACRGLLDIVVVPIDSDQIVPGKNDLNAMAAL